MTTSTLFLNNISVVDHAYINDQGKVIGGSFNPSFLVTGSVDPIEQVVVDFSTIKKDIKKIIDDHNTGFDHKLWLIDGYSLYDYHINTTIAEVPEDNIELWQKHVQLPEASITINTPHLSLTLPGNAIQRIAPLSDYRISSIGLAFEKHVQAELQKVYPKINISVKCFNSIDIHSFLSDNNKGSLFRYVHGLKDSTSYGCQNNSHGHLSFIQLLSGDLENLEGAFSKLQVEIANDLDNTVFIRKENIVREDDQTLTIQYTTARGFFKAEYQKHDQRLVVLDTETTIEHLAEYVEKTYRTRLQENNCTYLAISEGLSKGTLIKINP